jgi:hypothetical protein
LWGVFQISTFFDYPKSWLLIPSELTRGKQRQVITDEGLRPPSEDTLIASLGGLLSSSLKVTPYVFSYGSNLGTFDLEVPLDGNGEITLYVFCSGMAPYKNVFVP